jgi:hypothetical protein
MSPQHRGVAGSLSNICFDGVLLSRGFWLYVWEILVPDGTRVHYVGKTGDKASRACQSPFNRLSNHLGGNKHSNALKRHLSQRKIDPEQCQFQFHAYGPLFQEKRKGTHDDLCDITSGLEKELADAMAEAGYEVVNKIHCRTKGDAEVFEEVRDAFSSHFDKLLPGSKAAMVRESRVESVRRGTNK